MKSLILSLWLGILLFPLQLWGVSPQERTYSLIDIPNVHLSDSTRYVSDPAHYFTPQERDLLDEQVAQLCRSWGIEVALVVVPSLGDEPIESLGNELFRSWGLGSQTEDNGLLILAAIEDHKIRFEVGYGLEGVLTDGRSARIIRHDIAPHFQKENYFEGLSQALAAIHNVLERGGYSSDEEATEGNDSRFPTQEILIFLLLCYLLISFVVYNATYTKIRAIAQGDRPYNEISSLAVRYRLIEEEYRAHRALLLWLMLPLGLKYRSQVKRWLAQWEQARTLCPQCAHNTLELHDVKAHESYGLTAAQVIEQGLRSRKFWAEHCNHCSYHRVYSLPPNAPSPFTRCTQCGTYAYGPRQKYRSGNYEYTVYECLYCGKKDTKKKLRQSSAAPAGIIFGSGLGGFGGGSRGGSWGGGSWGGGSSGGGGATGSW